LAAGFACCLAVLVIDSVWAWFFGSAMYKYRFVHYLWVRKISLRLLSKQKGSFGETSLHNVTVSAFLG